MIKTILLWFVSLGLAICLLAKDCKADNHWTVGTISYSSHWMEDGNENGGRGWNEEHNGWFVGYKRVLVGQYENSEFEQSSFIAWTPAIDGSQYFSWMVGGATGYESFGIMPMLGISAHYKLVYVTASFGVTFAGLKYEF